MKKMYLKTVSVLLLCLLLITGCSAPPSSDAVDGMSFQEVYFPSGPSKASATVSLTLIGDSLDDLYKEADIAVIADVVEDDVGEYETHDVNECVAKIRVISAYKGDVAAGDELNIREIGTRRHEINGEYSADGVPLLHKDMRVLLFLSSEFDMPNGMKGHSIFGEYQGKLIFDTEGRLHESAELGSDSVTMMGDMNEMTYAAVTDKMQALHAAQAAENTAGQ